MGLPAQMPGPDESVTVTGKDIRDLMDLGARSRAAETAEKFREAWQLHENRLNALHLDRVRDLRLTIRNLRRGRGEAATGEALG